MPFNHRFITLLIPVLLAAMTSCDDSQPLKKSGAVARPDNNVTATEVLFLDQGWTNEDRQTFYYLSQGSELLPYHWFLALEQSDSDELFRADQHMKKLGYIPQQPDKNLNPDGLPIGFVKHEDPAKVSYNIKKEFLGRTYDKEEYPATNIWLGMTCSNCHTSEINYKGSLIRIDGGSSHADHEGFLTQLVKSLQATTSNPDKMSRFAHRVLDPNWNQGEQEALKDRVMAYTEVLDKQLLKLNKGNVPYGHGRLDAFGAILNRICATALDMPENQRPADAPVSYPFLWTSPQLDWVQYNSSAGNPINRNVGEVMGIYSHLKLTGTAATGQFTSTVNLQNLDRLEAYIEKLKAPAWPAEQLGKIDPAKVALGKRLYAQNCAKCHHIRDTAGNFPMTKDVAGKQFVTTVSDTPLNEIRTDPQMVQNFLGHKAKPGVLREFLEPKEIQAQEEIPRALLLRAAVKEVIKHKLTEAGLQGKELDEAVLRLNRSRTDPFVNPPVSLMSTYKARPLNGIWATAPFLHNGSVPNLYQLLLPEDQRMKTFLVGSNEFDPRQVGFRTDQGVKFNTALKGNLNTGHSGPGFTQTRKEDGTYRDYTDQERWALIEYMKTLL